MIGYCPFLQSLDDLMDADSVEVAIVGRDFRYALSV